MARDDLEAVLRVRREQLWCGLLERSGGPLLFGQLNVANAMYPPWSKHECVGEADPRKRRGDHAL